MKVILLQDVARIGRRFEVVVVPDGYALNLLIPKKQAEPATPENIKRLTAQAAHKAAETTQALTAFADVAEKIKGQTIEMAVEANEQEHMFQSLKPEAVVAVLVESGYVVNAAQVELSENIKTLGEHEITLSAGDIRATFTLNLIKK